MVEEIKTGIGIKEETKEVKKKVVKKEEIKTEVKVDNKGYYVCSRLNHPIELQYNGNSFMVAPRGQVWVEDKELVSKLPNGVYFRQII
jgi:hypothetical protein